MANIPPRSDLHYMNEILSTARTDFVAAIQQTLMPKARRKLNNELAGIVHENALMCGNDQQHMFYAGEIYSAKTLGTRERYPHPMNVLRPELLPAFKQYQTRWTEFIDENDKINGYVQLLFSVTDSGEDWLEAMPPQLRSSIQHPAHRARSKRLTPAELQSFKDNTQLYYQLITLRMTQNIIDDC